MSLIICACGKVTQEVDPKKKNRAKAFSLSIETPIYTASHLTEKIKEDPNFPSSNYLNTKSNEVYVAIYGIKKTGGLNRLSWGKATLSEKESKINNKTTKTLTSVAKNIHNVSVSNANLGETYINVKTPTTNGEALNIRSAKLRYGYSYYICKVYTTENNYNFFMIDEKTASDNVSISKNTLDPYDTFISILFLKILENNKNVLDKTPPLKTLKALLDPPFFKLLSYKNPSNIQKNFSPKKPIFTFDRELEKQLIEIINILYNTDKKEAESHINSLPTSILSKKSKDVLIANILETTIDPIQDTELTVATNNATSDDNK